MKIEEARQIAKERIEQLAAELERGQSETLKAYLAAMSRMPRYSLNNLLLIAAQRPDAQQVAGFTTWRRLGRFVRRGEHGIAIVAPCIKRRRPSGKSAEPQRNMLAKRTDDEADAVIGFRGAYVWDVSQTEGAPLPEFAVARGDPGVFLDRLVAFVINRGIELKYSQHIAPARGACVGSTIVLLPDLPPGEQLSTLTHELGHALLHGRDGRELVSRTVRETEAEAVAFVVCQAIGLDSITASADYVALYRGDATTLAGSLVRIQKTAAEIIAAIGPDV